jgi:murein DD-endopeptidase MepM/ murein hydrolase activator NlpD
MKFLEPRRLMESRKVRRYLTVSLLVALLSFGFRFSSFRSNLTTDSSALAKQLTENLLYEDGLGPTTLGRFVPTFESEEGQGGEDESITEEELRLLGGDFFTDQLEGPARPGSTLERMRKKFDVFYERFVFQSQDFIDLEPEEDSIPTLVPVERFSMSSGFGIRKSPFSGRSRIHRGIDLRASYGTNVRAAGSGRVVSATYHRSYGRMVIIDHGNGLESRYAQNSKILVKTGDQVKKGEHISKIGMTGRTTGPHLHFEIWLHGHPINPLKFVDIPFHMISREAFLRSNSAIKEPKIDFLPASDGEIDHDD